MNKTNLSNISSLAQREKLCLQRYWNAQQIIVDSFCQCGAYEMIYLLYIESRLFFLLFVSSLSFSLSLALAVFLSPSLLFSFFFCSSLARSLPLMLRLLCFIQLSSGCYCYCRCYGSHSSEFLVSEQVADLFFVHQIKMGLFSIARCYYCSCICFAFNFFSCFFSLLHLCDVYFCFIFYNKIFRTCYNSRLVSPI